MRPLRKPPAPRLRTIEEVSRCYPSILADHIKLLLRLFGQPAEAMGAILDRGSLLFASITVLAVTFAAAVRTSAGALPVLRAAVRPGGGLCARPAAARHPDRTSRRSGHGLPPRLFSPPDLHRHGMVGRQPAAHSGRHGPRRPQCS